MYSFQHFGNFLMDPVKGQIISKCFLVSSISSKKKERKNLTLLLWYLKSTCFRSFFWGNRRRQKPFRNYLTFNPVTIFCKTGLIYTFSCLMTFDVENTFLKYFFEKITKRGKMIDLFDTKIHFLMEVFYLKMVVWN